jgi:putative transposase
MEFPELRKRCYWHQPVALHFIDPGKPTQNAYIENWRLDYNQNRPHSSLNYQTPEEFAANRPFHKLQGALALEQPEGSAPMPIAHAAE